MAESLVCSECGGTNLTCVSGGHIYPHRSDPLLRAKWFWLCTCGAYVGCHRNTTIPLGTPAGPETRQARSQAHAAFDALWRRKMQRGASKDEARNAGYAWLAGQMGLDVADTHIGRFTKEQCAQVVELCRPYLRGRPTNATVVE